MPINAIRSFVMGNQVHPGLLAGDAARDRQGSDERKDASHDSVRLSDTSGDLSAMAKHGASEDVLDIVSTKVAELRTRLMEKLGHRMRYEGLDPEAKVSLRLDEEDVVRASGEEPAASKVEDLLAEDPSLGELFRELAAHSDLLRTLRAARVGKSRTVSGYQAYSRAAIELDGSSAAFVLTMLGSQATSYFDRQ
jgi:hypothetical protein